MPLGKPKEAFTKRMLKIVLYEGAILTNVAQDRDQWKILYVIRMFQPFSPEPFVFSSAV
jgi:hypothetical protein